MKIGVIGMGYIGLVTAVCFAEMGNSVLCYDSNAEKLKAVELKKAPYYEPGLSEKLVDFRVGANLTIAHDVCELIWESEFIFITVGTPSNADGSANLSCVDSVFKAIKEALRKLKVACSKVIIIRSTVPVGTTDYYCRELEAYFSGTNVDVDVVFNPEFLCEGNAIDNFFNPDRIILGTENNLSFQRVKSLYFTLYNRGIPLIGTNPVSAEIIKYASNIFLSSRVALINEISDFAECVGGRINDISAAIGLDGRIGKQFLKVSPGFGGSCFKKDLLAFSYLISQHGMKDGLIPKISESNEAHIGRAAEKVKRVADTKKRITVLGTTFKAGTDDLRESASIKIIGNLIAANYNVTAHDPRGLIETRKVYPTIRCIDDLYAAIDGADVVVVATEWQEYITADYTKIKQRMSGNIIVDLRNILKRDDIEKLGFRYFSMAN